MFAIVLIVATLVTVPVEISRLSSFFQEEEEDKLGECCCCRPAAVCRTRAKC